MNPIHNQSVIACYITENALAHFWYSHSWPELSDSNISGSVWFDLLMWVYKEFQEISSKPPLSNCSCLALSWANLHCF